MRSQRLDAERRYDDGTSTVPSLWLLYFEASLRLFHGAFNTQHRPV
jgi:hypothetical protein